MPETHVWGKRVDAGIYERVDLKRRQSWVVSVGARDNRVRKTFYSLADARQWRRDMQRRRAAEAGVSSLSGREKGTAASAYAFVRRAAQDVDVAKRGLGTTATRRFDSVLLLLFEAEDILGDIARGC